MYLHKQKFIKDLILDLIELREMDVEDFMTMRLGIEDLYKRKYKGFLFLQHSNEFKSETFACDTLEEFIHHFNYFELINPKDFKLKFNIITINEDAGLYLVCDSPETALYIHTYIKVNGLSATIADHIKYQLKESAKTAVFNEEQCCLDIETYSGYNTSIVFMVSGLGKQVAQSLCPVTKKKKK